MGIRGIPLISLSIHDDGVNSLDILASICTTFICIFCNIESNLTENGYVILTLGKL